MRDMTLTEFLLARIAEDEWIAKQVQAGLTEALVPYVNFGNLSHIARWDPTRVLAECEAKRHAIDAAWDDWERIEGEWGSGQSREQMSAKDDNPDVVRWLAMPFADHPDYREEWRP